MNRLSTEERARVIACLVEGNSQRATVRMTNVARQTVANLAVEIGVACERFADNIMRDNDEEWIRMRDEEPKEFEKAVQFVLCYCALQTAQVIAQASNQQLEAVR